MVYVVQFIYQAIEYVFVENVEEFDWVYESISNQSVQFELKFNIAENPNSVVKVGVIPVNAIVEVELTRGVVHVK